MARRLAHWAIGAVVFVLAAIGCTDTGSATKITIKDGRGMELKSLPPPKAHGEGVID